MQSKDNTCPQCEGTGKWPGLSSSYPQMDEVCFMCDGSGQQEDKPTRLGRITTLEEAEQLLKLIRGEPADSKPENYDRNLQSYLDTGGKIRDLPPDSLGFGKPEKPVMDEQLRGLPPVRRWLNDAYQYGLEANGHNEDLANTALNDIADRANKVLQALLATEYDRGRIDEAKTCEQAKRHDSKAIAKAEYDRGKVETIELIEGLIPKNLDPEAFAMTSEFNRAAPFDRTWNNGYNQALAELRQSLKEMNQ